MQKLEKIVLQLSDLWGRIQTSYQTGSVPVKLVKAYFNSEMRQEITSIGNEVKELVADVKSSRPRQDNSLHSPETGPEKSKEVKGASYKVLDDKNAQSISTLPAIDETMNVQQRKYGLVVR